MAYDTRIAWLWIGNAWHKYRRECVFRKIIGIMIIMHYALVSGCGYVRDHRVQKLTLWEAIHSWSGIDISAYESSPSMLILMVIQLWKTIANLEYLRELINPVTFLEWIIYILLWKKKKQKKLYTNLTYLQTYFFKNKNVLVPLIRVIFCHTK